MRFAAPFVRGVAKGPAGLQPAQYAPVVGDVVLPGVFGAQASYLGGGAAGLVFGQSRGCPAPGGGSVAQHRAAVAGAGYSEEFRGGVVETQKGAGAGEGRGEEFGGGGLGGFGREVGNRGVHEGVVEEEEAPLYGLVDGGGGGGRGGSVGGGEFAEDEGDEDLAKFGARGPTGMAVEDTPEHPVGSFILRH